MNPFVPLDPWETALDRDFTRPATHGPDILVLDYLAQRLRSHLARRPLPRGRLTLPEPSGREHTALVSQPQGFDSPSPLTLVGFFGQKNPTATPAVRQALWDIDDQLVAEVSQFPGILSLSCLELEDGNYGNLVVLASPEAADHWRTSPTHRRAVQEHSPKYYSSIRIHNGTLSGETVEVHRTKYYDFRSPSPWLAIREWAPRLELHYSN